MAAPTVESMTAGLMRKLAARYLPAPILQREKQGFMLPIAYWDSY